MCSLLSSGEVLCTLPKADVGNDFPFVMLFVQDVVVKFLGCGSCGYVSISLCFLEDRFPPSFPEAQFHLRMLGTALGACWLSSVQQHPLGATHHHHWSTASYSSPFQPAEPKVSLQPVQIHDRTISFPPTLSILNSSVQLWPGDTARASQKGHYFVT